MGHMLYLPGFLGLWLGYVFCDLTKCSGEGKSIGNLNIRSKSAIMTTKINCILFISYNMITFTSFHWWIFNEAIV